MGESSLTYVVYEVTPITRFIAFNLYNHEMSDFFYLQMHLNYEDSR